MVSIVEVTVSENLNGVENLPALFLPLDLVNILPVSFTCTTLHKKRKGKKKDVFLLALPYCLLPETKMALQWL